jgi:hypothetical protein
VTGVQTCALPIYRQQVILSATEDHKEALAAFLGKRAPEYRER